MARGAQMKAAALLISAAAAAPERRLGFSFGKVTADPGNPSSLGGSGGQPSLFSGMGGLAFPTLESSDPNVPMLTPEQDAEVSKFSDQFVENAIKAFLGKTNLPPDEMKCIQDNSGQIGSNVGRIAEQLGLVVQKAFDVDLPFVPDAPVTVGGSVQAAPSSFDMSAFGSDDDAGAVGSIADKILRQSQAAPSVPVRAPAPVAAAPAPAPVAQAASASDPALDFFYNQGRRLQALPGLPEAPSASSSSGFGMSSLPMAMEMGMYMKQITDETKQLVKTCIHSDAKLAFEEAGAHATSLQHITGHFLANGADVVNEMADMVVAYDEKDSARFGTDFGTTMRKIFLSNNTHSRLPEGLPSELEIANVSAGFLTGFFGPGTSLKVNLKKDPAHPLRIDMENCVHQNTPYFQQIWGAVMYLFGQQASGVGQTAASTAKAGGLGSDEGRIQFGTTLAFSMMELPQAMEKCGINEGQRDMIMDSVKALGSGMKAKVSLPQRDVPKAEIRDDLSKTVEKWAGQQWYEFGQGVGALLQESAVKFYPQKYSLDAGGLLKHQLVPQAQRHLALLAAIPASLAVVGALAAAKLRFHRGSRRTASIADLDLLAVEEGALE